MTPTTPKRRLIIWGPGGVGGAVLKAALQSDQFEVVGVRAFSPHKIGQDIGTLVGLDPVGVKATDSVEEILALDADCVIYTPKMSAAFDGKGMWREVDMLLRSGKNVISANSHHDAARTTWITSSQSPTSILRSLAKVNSIPTPGGTRALTAVRLLAALTRGPVGKIVSPVMNTVLEPVIDRVLPRQLSGTQVVAGCRAGGASVHGTGGHPGFAAEQLGMALAFLLDRPQTFHIAESGDISQGPPDMWLGLDTFGIGRELSFMGPGHPFLPAADIGYGDPLGNVAHALHGAGPDDLRVEGTMRGLPAVRDRKVGELTIKKGQVAVMHMTHHGYLGDRLVASNEECWYAGEENAYNGTRLPFGDASVGPKGWIFDFGGTTARVEAQLTAVEHPGVAMWENAMEFAQELMLNSVEGVCASEPGIVLNDHRPRLRDADGTSLPYDVAGAPVRVVVLGQGEVAAAIAGQATGRDGIDVVAVESEAEAVLAARPDCVIAVGDIGGDQLKPIVAAGIPIVSEQTPTGGDAAAQYVTGSAADIVADRLVATLCRMLDAPRYVRFVDALEGSLPSGTDAAAIFAELDETGTAAVLTRTAEITGVNQGKLRFEYDLDVVDGVSVHAIRRGYAGKALVLTHEVCRYIGADNAVRGDDLPIGGFTASHCYTIEIDSARTALRSQIQVTAPSGNTTAQLVARAALDAVRPVVHSPSGVLRYDTNPGFVTDERVR